MAVSGSFNTMTPSGWQALVVQHCKHTNMQSPCACILPVIQKARRTLGLQQLHQWGRHIVTLTSDRRRES
jgi:hypothetical protein